MEAERLGGVEAAVSVFDSRTANIHVDSTNDVAYTPLPLKMLAGLARACQDLKGRLKAEIEAIEKQTPAVIGKPECGPDTSVGKLLKGLNPKTKPEEVKALALLSSTETARLKSLSADLSGDPARTARQLRALKSRIDDVAARLRALRDAATVERLEALRGLSRTLNAARTAAAFTGSSEPKPSRRGERRPV